MSAESEWATLAVRPSTRDRVRSLKRGGESYDELVQKMADAYDAEGDLDAAEATDD